MEAQTVTTSTPVQEQVPAEARVVLRGVSWQTFQALLADVGDDRAWRFAYDQGVLEIRMPLPNHEEPKRLIESFVEALVDELGIELRSLDALTLEREELTRAIEPDSCFYSRENTSSVPKALLSHFCQLQKFLGLSSKVKPSDSERQYVRLKPEFEKSWKIRVLIEDDGFPKGAF
jgi:Uma2 family endonuclease